MRRPSCFLSHPLSLSLTHTHTLSLPLSLPFLYITHTHADFFHSSIMFPSVSFPLSHTHKKKHSHTQKHLWWKRSQEIWKTVSHAQNMTDFYDLWKYSWVHFLRIDRTSELSRSFSFLFENIFYLSFPCQ